MVTGLDTLQTEPAGVLEHGLAWLKSKNPLSEAVRREREDEWK
jgi:hypothetical protein